MIKQIGKIGKINIKANRKIKEMFVEMDIRSCEIKLEGCDRTYILQRVHRHNRHWYRGQLELLWDYKQVVLGCHRCHEKIESKKKLTEETFLRLRGKESY